MTTNFFDKYFCKDVQNIISDYIDDDNYSKIDKRLKLIEKKLKNVSIDEEGNIVLTKCLILDIPGDGDIDFELQRETLSVQQYIYNELIEE